MALPTSDYNEVCLNCKTTLLGEYCHYCGQQRIHHAHESFMHNLIHLLGDFVHFDKQVFATVIPLLFRPGFLTTEYLAGRRARYLNPIKSYVFLSFVFFFVFFLVNAETGTTIKDESGKHSLSYVQLNNESKENLADENLFIISGDNYRSLEQYDSVQRSLPLNKRDGKIKHFIIRSLAEKGKELSLHPNELIHDLSEKFAHNLPKLAFILLPVFALLLKLIYIRKEQTYTEHFIFSINIYNFLFLIASVLFPLTLVDAISEHIPAIFFTASVLYFFFALRKVYQESIVKTLVKLTTLSFIFCLCLAFSFVINLIVVLFI